MPKRRSSRVSVDSEKQKKCRRIIYSDSSDESQNSDSEPPNNGDGATTPVPQGQSEDLSKSDQPRPEAAAPELDAELLAALGDQVDDQPVYGDPIQAELAQRWLPLLRKGLLKDLKDTLIKENSAPDNCRLLRAPTLNAEISAAISDSARARDKKLEANQNQLGSGVTAVGRGLSLLLTVDDKPNKIRAIKYISDGARLLADLHFTETQARIKMLTPGLDKSFLHVIQDVERDETIFSSKLPQKIKASKTIEKQGLQIKKVQTSQKASSSTASHSQASSRPRNQGTWSDPSRYQSSSRGGRGGAQKYPYNTRASRGAPPPGAGSSAKRTSATHSNARAQAQ